VTAAPVALIIDDEIQIRRLLRLALESRGYKVHDAAAGQLGLIEAVNVSPDVILLDLGLPDMDGLEVLKRLREWSDVPVLILSVRDHESVKITALENGADDYVTKPFSTGELAARLAAIRRRNVMESQAEATLGHLQIDFSARTVHSRGEEVHLTPTEYALFKILARHAGKVVIQKQLLREVWGPQASGQAQYLRVYINHLRRKLSLTDDSDVKLINEPGIGYRLIS
jgi:two-component system KDP operon response regulator KdpE